MYDTKVSLPRIHYSEWKPLLKVSRDFGTVLCPGNKDVEQKIKVISSVIISDFPSSSGVVSLGGNRSPTWSGITLDYSSVL